MLLVELDSEGLFPVVFFFCFLCPPSFPLPFTPDRSFLSADLSRRSSAANISVILFPELFAKFLRACIIAHV